MRGCYLKEMLQYRAPLSTDFEALQALDLAQQRRQDSQFDTLDERERSSRLRTSLAALKFFERSEHSFVATDGGETLRGALLAQAVWQGDRPVVLVVQVLLSAEDAGNAGASDSGAEVAQGLLHACVKSAYDSAVYEVHFPLSAELGAAAHAEEARVLGQYAVCYLGSRAQTAPGQPI